MWSRNQRHSITRLFLRRLGMLALLFLVFLASLSVWRVYEKERESRKLRMQAEAEWTDLSARKKQLEASIAEVGTDRGLEEALREQYALAEQGEGLIVIVDPPAPEVLEATSTITNWFKKVLPWF